MSRWKNGRGKKGNSRKRYPDFCITCGSKIEYPKKSNNYTRNTPKVCKLCEKKGISRDRDWGCLNCMKGDSRRGVFIHKPIFCPSLEYVIRSIENLKEMYW